MDKYCRIGIGSNEGQCEGGTCQENNADVGCCIDCDKQEICNLACGNIEDEGSGK